MSSHGIFTQPPLAVFHHGEKAGLEALAWPRAVLLSWKPAEACSFTSASRPEVKAPACLSRLRHNRKYYGSIFFHLSYDCFKCSKFSSCFGIMLSSLDPISPFDLRIIFLLIDWLCCEFFFTPSTHFDVFLFCFVLFCFDFYMILLKLLGPGPKP